MSGPRRRREIFDAALRDLAALGFDRMTIEGVAERAGVNKTTIYRWWPSKAALLGAALVDAPLLDLPMPDTGTLRGDLTALVDGLIRLVAGGTATGASEDETDGEGGGDAVVGAASGDASGAVGGEAGGAARAALAAAVGNPELAAHFRAFFADRLAREQAIVDRAVRRGELRPGADTMLLMDLLAGAVWTRAAFRGEPVPPDFAARAVSAVLDGLR
ncbi:TetR/AcrR family transcriptional regulator [Actinomadura logoneensis]|uniref:TetR/AcrR family transcriptional regulator n=1 Tax=Actinomadura logoneensis TaxID=2293572 RepID=A0A372JAT4_9ACTN|nr:TetR/AcrR family transcriptional regulator [Actinomadura logoneensis]RFU36498.1 TetR/AcrR family transcriptional regulator [Actinomadura logoneensis]